jgi:hypothetical protein
MEALLPRLPDPFWWLRHYLNKRAFKFDLGDFRSL